MEEYKEEEVSIAVSTVSSTINIGLTMLIHFCLSLQKFTPKYPSYLGFYRQLFVYFKSAGIFLGGGGGGGFL